jgi:hypothetical protein
MLNLVVRKETARLLKVKCECECVLQKVHELVLSEVRNYCLSVVEFWERSQNCDKRTLASSCLSVCLSVRTEQLVSI